MSQAERDDLIPLARKVRADARRDALQVVVEAAQSFYAEREREYEDSGHGGRLRGVRKSFARPSIRRQRPSRPAESRMTN